MTIKNAVKVSREALGWSARQLAVKAEVSPSTILNLERGEDVTLSVAQQVAKALQVSLQDLFDLEEALAAPNNELLQLEAEMRALALQMIHNVAPAQVAPAVMPAVPAADLRTSSKKSKPVTKHANTRLAHA